LRCKHERRILRNVGELVKVGEGGSGGEEKRDDGSLYAHGAIVPVVYSEG
jgi:hypothetical protein